MKKLLFASIIILASILQVTLIDSFKVFNVKPDLILLSAVIASLIFEFRWSVFLCVFAGMLKDVFATGVIGINTLLFPLWCVLIARLNKEINIDDDLFRIIIAFVITFLHNTMTGLILLYLGETFPLGIFLRIVCVESIYTTLALLLIFKTSAKFTFSLFCETMR